MGNKKQRIYKSGDLARFHSDGRIEFLGRVDQQVKIRGFRIELGEIENQLSSISGIKQSCVLAKDRNNNKYLVALYVCYISILLHNPFYILFFICVMFEDFPEIAVNQVEVRFLRK